MQILPINLNATRLSTSFGKKLDIKEALNQAINNHLQTDSTDSFVPYSPSQPIIIEKVEISSDSKKDKSSSDGAFITGTGTGIAGSTIADKIKNKSTNKELDLNKLIDEKAKEDKNSDLSINEIVEDDELNENNTEDDDIDCDSDDYDE